MKFVELGKEEFDIFADKYSISSPYQTKGYGEALKDDGYTPIYVGLKENDTIIAASLILIKSIGNFRYAYAPRGYLIDYSNYELLQTFTKGIKKFLRIRKVTAIKLCPPIIRNIYDNNYNLITSNENYNMLYNSLIRLKYRHLGYNNFFEALKPRFEATIDLTKDYFTLFMNMDKRFRTKVRNAEKNGVRIYEGDIKDIDTLYEQAKAKYPRGKKYLETLYSNLMPSKAAIYYAKIDLDALSKNSQNEFVEIERLSNIVNDEVLVHRGKLHQKLIDKKIVVDKKFNIAKEKLSQTVEITNEHPDSLIIATVFVVKTNDKVTIMLDSYDKKYTRYNAKHLIIWKLMEKYSKEGYKEFVIGGVTNKIDKDNKYFGLDSYRLGFGSRVYEYVGDFELVTNRLLYFMYINNKKK